MHRAAALASRLAAGVRDGDVMYMWEPLYHIGGTQVLILALEQRVTLAMTTRFSVSRFWDECREEGVTQIHFLGGILQMLLTRAPDARDRDHPVRIAWGGGAPPGAWRAFEDRFGVQVRENYGMTEASSLTSINDDGRFATVGRPAPWFEVRIEAEDGSTPGPGGRGEILVREREPGLITPGYFRNPEATARALRDGWLHTGDLGCLDADGYLVFLGRLKDCIRRRGENISAWEIEHVVNAMPQVEECAVIGVPSALGEEEIKLFVKPVESARIDPAGVFRWCEERLSAFQVPLYLAVVDGFEKTGTQRIRKETLSRSTGDCSVRPA
jgi:crotonobetaine/carnitine-CoA ligase